jgi:anaerobic magnesium-protoporphyrin IX monomethyl ester cyclase
MKPYPPLATLLAAGVLRERGHEVSFFDAMLARGTDAFEKHLARIRPDLVVLIEDNFNFLTKMCTVRMREAALRMIRAACAQGASVAVNGSDAIDQERLYLEAGAGAIIVGEVEPTLTDLVDAWQRGGDLDQVAGLALPSRNGGVPVRTASRPYLDRLDQLPLPAWDLVDVERYRSEWRAVHGRFSWNIVTSRGCPYRCNWCAKPIWGTRYAQRSPEAVADEMARLKMTVRPDHIWFADDIFGLTPDWIERFGAAVSRRAARTPFMMQSRVNLMKPRVVDALAAAGAEEVWLGVESGSQRVLDSMDKGTTVEQARIATRNLRARGIRTCWFIQLGYPGEEWEDVIATRDLVRDEMPDDIGVSVSYPLPGTVFHARVQTQLGAKRNWGDSDDLAMMFQGTYVTEFYRQIRSTLHDEVRLERPQSADVRDRFDERWDQLAQQEAEFRSEAPIA